jgi:branched-chain amino acid aminotransferase
MNHFPMWIYLNNRFVSRDQARVSIFDHGFLYGDGVYETLRAYGGRLFMLRQHLERLERSARLIGLTLPLTISDWPPLLEEALRRNGLSDAYLRLTISRGEGSIGLDPSLCTTPTLVVIAQPLPSYPPHLYDEGVRLIISQTRRNLAEALPPHIKSLNFLNNILAKREATLAKVFDAVMLNVTGHLAECTTSNLFFVRHGRLCTPAVGCGILDGITRNVVLQLARARYIEAEEGTYPPADVFAADECFLTNTTMEIMPVRSLNDRPIGHGKPGPLTQALRSAFRSKLQDFLQKAPGLLD